MAEKFEIDGIRRSQAALEAIKVLQDAGFSVQDHEITTEGESATVDLDLTLAIGQNTRPLAE